MSERDKAYGFWHEIIYNEDLEAAQAWRDWGEERYDDPNSKAPEYEKVILRALAIKVAKVRERYGDDWMTEQV